MIVSVTLRQEKTILTSDYRLVSTITAYQPNSLKAPFVVSEGLTPQDELWERVATLDDLAEYTENALIYFYSETPGEFNGIGAIPGDKLTVDTPPESWLTLALTEAKFTVATVDGAGDFLTVVSSIPFPTAADGLSWTLKSAGGLTTRATGVNAKTQRENTLDTVFLRSHWTELFDNVKKAQEREISNETLLRTLVTRVKTLGSDFEGVETQTFTET